LAEIEDWAAQFAGKRRLSSRVPGRPNRGGEGKRKYLVHSFLTSKLGKGTCLFVLASEENGKRGKNTRSAVRIQVKSKSYLHSGDTKHVMAGMAIITLVFGVPWFLMNKGWFSFLLILYHISMSLNRLGCFNISFGLVIQ